MSKTGIFFGSSTGNTETVAESIAEKLNADIFNVADCSADDLSQYQNLILGTSTWGLGDLQDDWEAFISDLEGCDLNGKVIAFFGCGDGESYPDTFVDGISKLYEAVNGKGCKIVGNIGTDGYEYDASEAEVDGKFIGLVIDEDNQSDMTDERIDAWVETIKAELQ